MFVVEGEKPVDKHIIVHEKHDKWLDKNAVNLSKWIRRKIEEEMEVRNSGSE